MLISGVWNFREILCYFDTLCIIYGSESRKRL